MMSTAARQVDFTAVVALGGKKPPPGGRIVPARGSHVPSPAARVTAAITRSPFSAVACPYDHVNSASSPRAGGDSAAPHGSVDTQAGQGDTMPQPPYASSMRGLSMAEKRLKRAASNVSCVTIASECESAAGGSKLELNDFEDAQPL